MTYRTFVSYMISGHGAMLAALGIFYTIHSAQPHEGAALIREMHAVAEEVDELQRDVKTLLTQQARIIRDGC